MIHHVTGSADYADCGLAVGEIVYQTTYMSVDCPDCLSFRSFYNARDVRFMEREITAMKGRIAELEAQLRWTPVEEGLPSLGQHTLVRLADGEVTSGFWDGSGWECIGAYYAVRHITHWMTLPKAPEVKP